MKKRLAEWTRKSVYSLRRARQSPFGVSSSPRRRRLQLSSDPDLIYAIGDVHGCLAQLRALEKMIVEDAAEKTGTKLIVMLGDYIDRGPNSAGVLEHLIDGPPEGFHRVCLCGNHDQVFLDVLTKPSLFENWLAMGGDATLASYGLNTSYLLEHLSMVPYQIVEEIRRAVPAAHVEGMKRMPVSLMTPGYFFAHAGARPGIPWGEQTEIDLMWIREDFLSGNHETFDRIVVHGHTVVRRPFSNFSEIAVDTGAFLGGPLTAARIEKGSVSFLCTKPG